MLKRLKKTVMGLFLTALFALAAPSLSATALQLTSLEPHFDANAKIEINETEAPYDFEATLLDKNQTLEYRATILNDLAEDIEITSIDITNSSYDFLDYSFADIASGDVISKDESKDLKIFVKSNDESTQTVDEDLNLQIHYKTVTHVTPEPVSPEEPENEDDIVNPNTYSNVAAASVAAIAAGVILIVIFKKSSRIRIGAITIALPILGLLVFASNANAESDLTFTILGKVHFVNLYNVTINPNGGIYKDHTEAYTETVRDGAIVRLDEATRATYNFNGWTADQGEISNNTITIHANTTITAQWKEIYHTVSIDPDGGSYNNSTNITTVQVRNGGKFTIGNDPVRDSYSFQGWSIIPNDLNPEEEITVTQDVSYKALWNENYFNVTIDPNGGEYLGNTASYTEPYREGTEVTMQTPTRDTYRFVGWQMSVGELDSNNKFNVTTDVVLTAQWEEIYYTVTIYPNGGVYNGSTEPDAQAYRAGAEVTIGTATRNTYNFAGWTADPDILGQDNKLIVTSDVDITANWEEIYHNLTINPNGGTYGGKTASFTTSYREGAVIPISTPTRETYSFSGWDVQGSQIESGSITLLTDTVITAQWGEIMHTLTINPNGGTYGEHTESFGEEYHEGTVIDIATPTRDTYNFAGWTAEGDSIVNNQITLTQNTTLTAQWEEIYHNVTINPNGGTYLEHTESYTESYREGAEVTMQAPTRDTYRFVGWQISVGELNDNKFNVTTDVTLTAQWEEIYHNLTINPNGGTYGDKTTSFTTSYREGAVISISTPTRETYSFSGWDVEGDSIVNNQITLTQDTIITAQWGENMHSLTINPNGGAYGEHTEPFSEDHREGAIINIATPTRDTYRFTGWDVEGDSIVDNQITLTQDTTLTAQWEEIYYTLTIDPNGGNYEGRTQSFDTQYRAGADAQISTPSKEGCDFTYWKLEDNSQFTGDSIQMTRNITLVAQYEDQYFNVTVNPNGGKFNNSTSVYTDRVKYGTVIDLTDAEYTNHEIRDWTKNETETLASDITEITITSDTDLVINWWSIVFHTITINPNEGVYNESSETQEFQVREGESFTIEEATREGYALSKWTFEDNSTLNKNSFIVDGDHTLTANWFRAVARIERTQKIYPSIMAAHEEANPENVTDDVITLLVDTEEVVTNEKKVTLDLNYHTVTGYLTNTANGDLTLINGEINNYTSPIEDTNNPDGAAVINNGILTMGIDDKTSDGTVNILRDNIRLIGTKIGLKQDNIFYFYDGFIEGEVGLDGGYDGSPFYINISDGTTLYYFPFVTHNDIKDCQHVELQSVDRAVSRTIEHGHVYYYDLQDNVNTSAKTGYTIYAIRNFDASYTIDVAEDADILFDLDGYVVSAGNDWTVDGKLTITDSKANTDAGALRTSRVITNNNELIFENTQVTALSANPIVKNNKNLTLKNSTLSSEYGYALEVNAAQTKLTMDSTSYISTSTKDIIPVHNTSTDFVIDGGNIESATKAILNEKNAKLTIKSGNIKSSHSLNTSSTPTTAITNKGNLFIKGGTITAESLGNTSSELKAISNESGSIAISDGVINCSSIKGNVACIQSSGQATFSGGDITATGYARTAAFKSSGSSTTITNGNFTATSTNSEADGIWIISKTVTISGGNITATAQKSGQKSSGITATESYSYFNINGNATIRAYSNNGIAAGVYGYTGSNIITAGDIYGDTYGVQYSTNSNTLRIGTNNLDEEGASILINTPVIKGGQYGVYNGDVDYFDGILLGGVAAASSNTINTIPHDAEQKYTTVDGYEKTWLEHASDYLEVDGVGYNSLKSAYDAAKNSTSETKLITATKNHSTSSTMPEIESGQEITLDLHGFTLQYTETLPNHGHLTIVDNGSDTAGVIENINIHSIPTITNYNTIDQNGGIVKGRYMAYKCLSDSRVDAKVNLNAGKAIVSNSTDTSTVYTLYGNGPSSSSVININEGFDIEVFTANATAYAIYYASNINLNGGTITAESTASSKTIYGIANSTFAANSGSINVTSDNSTTKTIYSSTGTINGGTYISTSKTKEAYAIDTDKNKTVTINDGALTASSKSSYAYGFKAYSGSSNAGKLILKGGAITASSESGTSYGAKLGKAKITGGSIHGGTYGIYGDTVNDVITLGNDDGTISNGQDATPTISSDGEYVIYGGYINFYDGVLIGLTSYSTDAIKAIPDGATIFNKTIDDTNYCWLKIGDPYLHIRGGGDYFSLTDAYTDAVSGDIIEVLDDYSTPADLPSNPTGKTITLDLMGHHLSYYQTLQNYGTMIVTNSDTRHEGVLENINPATTATITNGSSNNTSAKLEIQSGVTITSAFETIDNFGALEITGGTVSVNNANNSGYSYIYAIKNSNNATLTIPQSAQSPIVSASSKTNHSIAISGGTVEIYTGTVEGTSTSYAATGILEANSTIKNATINTTAPDKSYAIDSGSLTTIEDGSVLTAISTSKSAAGIYNDGGTAKINGGTITATGHDNTWGVYAYWDYNDSSNIIMTGGTITATSSHSTGYGAYAENGTFRGGKIQGSTYGVYAFRNSTVFTIGDNTDGIINTESPEIIGETYAVYSGKVNFYDGVLKGQVGTNSGAYFDNNIKSIADNAAIHIETENINGIDYEVKYLVASSPVARINDTTDYNSLYEAVENAVTGDEIKLLEDNYVFNNIVVDDDQDITIDLNDHTIISGLQITNNGKLTIKNHNQSVKPVINYHEDNGFIKNTKKTNSQIIPELTLDNVEIHAKYVVDSENNAKVTVINGKLYGDYSNGGSAIKGYGTADIKDGSYIYAPSTAIALRNCTLNVADSTVKTANTSSGKTLDLDNCTYTIDNSEINALYKAIETQNNASNGAIKNNSKIYGGLNIAGELEIKNSIVSHSIQYNDRSMININNSNAKLTISNTKLYETNPLTNNACPSTNSLYGNSRALIQNSGTLIANTIELHSSFSGSNSCGMNYINNLGNATIDGLIIDNDDSESTSSNKLSGVGIVNNGQMVLTNADININRATSYGIYTVSGDLEMTDTAISVEGQTVYGAYIDNGNLIMGIPEPTTSPNYGTGDADVSVTDPSITAIGTTSGIGVYKNLGKFMYYDGIIVGNTAAIPRDNISTDVEHLYEPTFHTDANGYDVCILTWMPQQPSQPGQADQASGD